MKLKNIIGIVLVLILGILVYNRFWGTPEEQAQAKNTFQTIGKAGKEIGQAIGGLVKSEKEKFDAGKYNGIMDKMGNFFHNLGDKAKDLGKDSKEFMDTINELKEKKEALEEKMAEFSDKNMTDEESIEANEEVKRDLKNLDDEIKRVARDAGISVE